ncbi:MAG: hypothetical protein GYA51_06425 [Candidatus Methanofastidiosa archaeon]|jgi:hypothetical protein|nr:hypothetical protein [Candidatus Methanofastidiosa archaeon]
MRAKFIYESIGDILKPKSDKEILTNAKDIFPSNLKEHYINFVIEREAIKSRVWNFSSEMYILVIGKDFLDNLSYWIMFNGWDGWKSMREGYLYDVIHKIDEGDLYDLDNQGFKWRKIYKQIKSEYPNIYKEALKRPIINK